MDKSLDKLIDDKAKEIQNILDELDPFCEKDERIKEAYIYLDRAVASLLVVEDDFDSSFEDYDSSY